MAGVGSFVNALAWLIFSFSISSHVAGNRHCVRVASIRGLAFSLT